ncbi:MAG: NmrA family transcriptional regulator [Cellulomonas sp. 73-145]|uniref:SDR family oxidoreductase n=1 Tax=Cellulomonas sp. 73-145 TaxID=1895739 RepID=UPI00092A2C55|nr:NAD(P)H-binding protein [Cellulomonas sp. 73-145]OJV60395.1 MAG: NmrA family transcriptional regulator [Cellulomonas sp. 73-145]
MTTTLVTGATGTLGTPTVLRLRAAGHDVRALSRRTGPGLTTGDLVTGAGLDRALAGVDTVVHLATAPRAKGDVEAARTLLTAAADAHVQHLVLISIVGIDGIPLAYYRDKVVIERLVRQSGVPFTILRATQFHGFVEALFTGQRALPVVVAPAFTVQPIAAEEVADRLVELASDRPAGRVPDIGGPEQRTVPELARLWRGAVGGRRPVLPFVLPGKTFAGYRSGAGLVPGTPYGRVTFADHLAARSAARR